MWTAERRRAKAEQMLGNTNNKGKVAPPRRDTNFEPKQMILSPEEHARRVEHGRWLGSLRAAEVGPANSETRSKWAKENRNRVTGYNRKYRLNHGLTPGGRPIA